MVPSPDQWFYRNKMEYAFGVADGGTGGRGDEAKHPSLSSPSLPVPPSPSLVLGLRQAGRWDRFVHVEACLLMSPESQEILRRVRTWAATHNLSAYHRGQHVGDLRYLVVREGKNTNQRMVILISNKTVTPASTAALAGFRQMLEPLATTGWLGVTDGKGDNAWSDQMTRLWGPGQIEERLGDIRYQISPFSFFQTNTKGCERLYSLLQDWGRSIGGALVDLYCGSGGITLSLARSFDRVVGIDTNRPAIEDARAAAAANGLGNTEFVCEDAQEFLKKLPGSKLSVQLSAMIVDPPRPGLHPKALQALIEMNPPKLAYVSCNPESLARDLQSLAPLYRINSVQLVDLFPNTPHVETVCLMEHR